MEHLAWRVCWKVGMHVYSMWCDCVAYNLLQSQVNTFCFYFNFSFNEMSIVRVTNTKKDVVLCVPCSNQACWERQKPSCTDQKIPLEHKDRRMPIKKPMKLSGLPLSHTQVVVVLELWWDLGSASLSLFSLFKRSVGTRIGNISAASFSARSLLLSCLGASFRSKYKVVGKCSSSESGLFQLSLCSLCSSTTE